MSAPVESRVHVNGVELCLFEWPGEPPPLLLVHATGFHARCWDQTVAALPGVQIYAVDMRGHGRSEKPPAPYPWSTFGDDVAALAELLNLHDAVGVGHSMGGHSSTIAAARQPGRFAALLLVDPVIGARSAYGRPRAEGPHGAARRRNEFSSPDAMVERFEEREPFKYWDRRVLRDYCEYGLLPAPDGQGFVLACPPEVEAAIYAGSMGTDVYGEIAAINMPVRVLRSARTDRGGVGGSPAAPDLATHFPNARDFLLRENSHFVPMESPALVARHAAEMRAEVVRAART